MTRGIRLLAVFAVLCALLAAPATASSAPRTPAASASRAPSAKTAAPARRASTATKNPAVARTADGKIKRSEEAKLQFMRQTGFPHGRPGYIIDHIKPLACGGADATSNMQWQTVAAAKAKDKVERIGCR